MHKFRYAGTLKVYKNKATFIPDNTSQDLRIMELNEVKGYLNNDVKFDEGKVTLSTLIDIVISDLDFYSYAIGIDLRAFCNGVNSPVEQTPLTESRFDDKVDTMEVAWTAESHTFEKEKVVEFYTRFHGWGKQDSPYDMGLAPVVEYINIPIILNEEVIVYTSDYSCKEEHEHDFGHCGKFDYHQYELGNRKFTLLQVLHAVFFDLTFYGMPGSEAKENFGKELEKGLADLPPDDDELNAFDVEEEDDELENDNGPEED